MSYERATFVFLFLILAGMFGLAFMSLHQQKVCEQTAMAQNYSADSIKKICK